MLTEVGCDGTESALVQCPSEPIADIDRCVQDAEVVCQGRMLSFGVIYCNAIVLTISMIL